MDYKIGDKITVTGKPYYTSYGGSPGKYLENYSGTITHINNKSNVPYPVHVDQKGWFAISDIVSETTAIDEISSNGLIELADNWTYDIGSAQRKIRRTSIACVFQGKNITADTEKYLISFSYTDNEENTADDINLVIDDRDNEWLGWLSSDKDIEIKGAEIGVAIIKHNWNNDGRDEVMDCGVFEVDTVDIDGPPQKITFKASALSEKSGAKTSKTKVWENYTIEGIANEISGNCGFVCKYYSITTAYYNRIEQNNETDIAFLSRLCKNMGISLKVCNKAIILFDQTEYEQKDAVMTITRDCGLINYKLKKSANDSEYNKCTVKYENPKTKKTITGEYTDKNIKDGKTLTITDIQVNSKAEAETLAKKKLREKNREGDSITFTLPGDFRLNAGVNINVKGWYGYDGKYMIETATHNVTGGYTTTVLARKVLEGY